MISFDGDSRALSVGFEPFARGIEFSGGAPLFRIAARPPGPGAQEMILEDGDLELESCAVDGGAALLRYRKRFARGASVAVTVRLERSGKEAIGAISAEVSGAILLRQVQFPVIACDVYHFDRLLMSAPWGDNIGKPVETIAQYCAGKGSSWVYDYVKCGDNEIIYTYPSIMAMQYMALHNAARTLYVGCYDGTGNSTTTFHAKVAGKSALSLSIGHHPFLENGRWESPACGFALLPGGWHAAADLYAAHMRGRFAAPDSPPWMRADETGWNGYVQIMMRLEGKPPVFRYTDLPAVFKRVKDAGMETLHAAGWCYDGFDTRYPDYDADPALGSADDLKGAIEEIHAMGGRVILYTNGRLVDPDSRFYKQGGDRCVCMDENGMPYIERYNTSADFRIACPDCDAYGAYLAGQVRGIAADLGADAIQIDQISCNQACFCYDKSHSHSTPASNFLGGVSRELLAVRRAHRGINPGFFTWCEGCHERFGQFYDVNQGHGEEHTWQLGDSVPEQFLYTYPDRWVTGISGNVQQLCHTFAQGKPFDLPLAALDDEEYVRLLKSFIAIRRAHPGFFYRGVFVDNRGIDVTAGVRAFGRVDEQGNGILITLWKPGAEAATDCSALLRISGAGPACRAIYPDDESLAVSSDGDVIRVKWRGPVAVLRL